MRLPYNLPVLISGVAIAAIDWLCRILALLALAFLLITAAGCPICYVDWRLSRHDEHDT